MCLKLNSQKIRAKIGFILSQACSNLRKLKKVEVIGFTQFQCQFLNTFFFPLSWPLLVILSTMSKELKVSLPLDQQHCDEIWVSGRNDSM